MPVLRDPLPVFGIVAAPVSERIDVGDTGGVWVPLVGTIEAPTGAESAYCALSFAAASGQDFSANLDDLSVRPGALIFTDGFESGDVSAWSASVP